METYFNNFLNENFNKKNNRRAFVLKKVIGDIRLDDRFWETNNKIFKAKDELRTLGYFYDDDSWSVYPLSVQ